MSRSCRTKNWYPRRPLRPAQEDVAGGLHQPLPHDDSLALVLVDAPARVRCEHRRTRLLHLQEEGMAFGGGEETHQAAGADAADADDLHREVFQAVAIEQHAAIVGQRQAIVFHPVEEHLLHALLGDVEEHRRLVHQAVPAIDRGRQLGKQILADALAGLLDQLLPDLSRLGIGRVLDQGLHVQTLVPDVQRAPFRAVAHVLPVGAHARDGRLPGLRIGAAVVAGRHGKARRRGA